MSAVEPWVSDRELDAEGAAAAIRHAVPELASADVRLLGSGWDFDAYEADGGWVFRFPRRAKEEERLQKDLALLPWLAARWDAPLPTYAWGPLTAPSFPYIFSGYRKLDGVQAAEVDPASVDLDTLGRSLGAMLRPLHALEVPSAWTAMLTRTDPRNGPRALRDDMRKHGPAFAAAYPGALGARVTRFLEDDTLLPRGAAPAPRLVHDDLHAEHLLLDPEAPHRIAGLIDWSDACLGDLAREFACIYPWGGEPLLQAMLAGYGPVEPRLPARARFLGLCLALGDWAHWTRTGQTHCAQWPVQTLEVSLPGVG